MATIPVHPVALPKSVESKPAAVPASTAAPSFLVSCFYSLLARFGIYPRTVVGDPSEVDNDEWRPYSM